MDIQVIWETLIYAIKTEISEPRRQKVLDLYNHYEDRIKVLPASTKEQFHSAFEGGYVYHVLNVMQAAAVMEKAWNSLGVHINWTHEELMFAALNHDLGKIGDETGPLYLPNDSQWHIKNRGELYKFNDKIPFMEVHDRSLFILQQWGIPVTFNETLAIRLHGGLWDKGTESYLVGYNKPQTSLPYILHQADLAAARIEYEQQWLFKPKDEKISIDAVKAKRTTKKDIEQQFLGGNEAASNLKNILGNL